MSNVIYQIVNLVNQKRYIGFSVNFESRKKRHIVDLKNGNHHNIPLQRAYNKYGKDNFRFEIIDTVRYDEELPYRENYWFSKYDFEKDLYNTNPSIGSLIRKKLTKKQKDNMSKRMKGKNHPFYGKKLSKEHCKNLSKAHMGNQHTEETKKKIFENSVLKKKVAQIDLDNNIVKIYDGIREASRETGIDNSSISRICRGAKGKSSNGNPRYYHTAGGYKWEFVEND